MGDKFTKLQVAGMTLWGVVVVLFIVIASTFTGCASMDATAHATTQPGVAEALGLAVTAATGNPAVGTLAALVVSLAANVYLRVRKGQYKTALRTVVNTVEPFIPEDEPSRDKLKEAQGPTTTALVKKAKA
jgi:hypothetical protein